MFRRITSGRYNSPLAFSCFQYCLFSALLLLITPQSFITCTATGTTTGQSNSSSSSRRSSSSNGSTTLSGKSEILEAEQLLAGLGYWTGPVGGTFDLASRHALVAFQKVERRPRTGLLTREELDALRRARPPLPHEKSGSPHIEVDLDRQVLFLVDGDGAVTKVLPVSTGSMKSFTEGGRTRLACTPCGRFKIFRKVNGWRWGPLGPMYYPSYFNQGVSIHGSPFIPVYPASHGCVRIPMFAAKELSKMIPVGMEVLVF